MNLGKYINEIIISFLVFQTPYCNDLLGIQGRHKDILQINRIRYYNRFLGRQISVEILFIVTG